MTFALHPAIDQGVTPGSGHFSGGNLSCHCADQAVTVAVHSDVAHNHACGCTKCWKPDGAAFSVVGVVARDKVTVTAHNEKLIIVDDSATIQRHACNACGVHLYGRIENESHAFYGLDFVHAELFDAPGATAPGFAAFVSSIIEGGIDPAEMADVRAKLAQVGLPPYDCLNPTLMDVLATHAFKQQHPA
jgi:S-(hydroxymethyl)glutathione synthase